MNDLTVKFACEAVRADIPAGIIAFDSWFAVPGTISCLMKEAKLTVITRLKTNAKQYYEYDGKMMNIKTIYSICRKRRGKAAWKLSVSVNLLVKEKNKIIERIPVKIVYLPNRANTKEWVCLLSTDTEMAENEIIREYGKRWKIIPISVLFSYYLDKEFGFMFVKIQTWFPFNIQIYINGRELMKAVFDRNGISYQCYDNSFTDISDVAKAQELADKFDSKKLSRSLDFFAKSINPFLDTVQNTFGQGYYWCVNQCEFATDVMFKERSFLGDIYPSLVGHAFYDFTCTDVFTFMGRKLDPRFQGEAVSDYKDRPVGCRVKFKPESNSIKMYDKCSVLRIETTINNPRRFKVYATVHHHDGTESKEWKPMGKSISNLYRYAEVSKACNQRFLDAMVDIVPVKSTLDEIGKICSRKKIDGKTVTGFNVWSPEVVCIMETVCDGRYLMNGFRNRDIGKIIFPAIKDLRKLSSKVSRLLKKLRQHGLIKNVPKSRRYHVTSKGGRIMGALIELRHREYPALASKTA